MTDAQLIAGCKKGNTLAQRQLYDRHHPRMLGVCIRYAQSREEAQDILQEGFIKVFMNISSYKGTGSFEGWVRKIMVNTALAHYRQQRTLYKEVELDKAEPLVAALPDTTHELQAQDVLRFIQRLPAGYRMVFNLFAIEGYTHEEIARELGISVNTSYSQYHRARTLLQKAIGLENLPNPKVAI